MTTNYDRDESEVDDTARDAARRAKEGVENAGRTAADKTEGMGKRISDAVEDVIPGDSDNDGH
ncbi:MAG: hypothetical protein ABI894_10325 [Ilumatobacteraceae bacterium]